MQEKKNDNDCKNMEKIINQQHLICQKLAIEFNNIFFHDVDTCVSLSTIKRRLHDLQ